MTAIDERIELPSPAEGYYDHTECMVCREISSPGYHTRIRSGLVHPTRESLNYAADLCASGVDGAIGRAADIIDRVIGLQDQDENSATWGIWSWYLEEPLSDMAPPDWNWADFCGALLLEIVSQYGDRLDTAVVERINVAIRHAAGSVRRRNVNLDYTNIAALGTYVTLHAGQHLNWPEMTAYALDRLRRFHQFTETNGAFTEYNSPTYTLVTLEELNRLCQVAPAGEPSRMAEALYRRAWEEVADHFHPPTEQWAGPHSRCYSTVLEPQRLKLIEDAAKGRLSFKSLKARFSAPTSPRFTLKMPNDLVRLFQRLSGPTQRVDVFEKGQTPVVGTTFLHPLYTLGSVNHANLWRQQRPLLAYWGKADAPGYLRVRFLRNGDDFHAAHLSCVQSEGHALAVLRFSTDGGILHPFFDRLTDGTFEAEDLRLRFEVGGPAREAWSEPPCKISDPMTMNLGNPRLSITAGFAQFMDSEVRWERRTDADTENLDLVLYHGRRTQVDLRHATAAIGFRVQLVQDGDLVSSLSTAADRNEIELQAGDLKLQARLAPATTAELRRRCTMFGGPQVATVECLDAAEQAH